MSRRTVINLIWFNAIFGLLLWWAFDNIVSWDRIERPYTITADIERTSADEGGVIVAMGSHAAGYSFFLKDGRLGFDYNDFGNHTVLSGDADVPVGRVTVGVAFSREGEGAGTFTLSVDGGAVASANIPRRVNIFGSMGLDVGRDGLSPVSEAYEGPFPFTGTLHEVRYEIAARRPSPTEATTDERAGFGTQ